MIYSGDKRLLEIGLAGSNSVATQCRRNHYLTRTTSTINVDLASSNADLAELWKSWTDDEHRRRIGYGCWVRLCPTDIGI